MRSFILPPLVCMGPEIFVVCLERMFGPGIYSTEGVVQGRQSTQTTWGASQNKQIMIVNHVALGRSKIMYEASHDMQHAPPMYNSVRLSCRGKVLC